ncbi:MAG: hypothetical protein IPK63_18525 [Candidatus Competibacteraceae bacterium]|nr:hypothetical protein [Candidatus Competibacteraceae bacterium]
MADRSVTIELLLKAKDTASSVLAKIVGGVKFRDSEISVVAGKILRGNLAFFGGRAGRRS